ncbi:SMI1/KNR4 family protein [Rhodobacteraceae bacterium]|nr:SMI1/KNR4 family protein [Paracoccaceae bacterium]
MISAQDQDLISAVRLRVMQTVGGSDLMHAPVVMRAPPATAQDLAAADQRLGLVPPVFLRRLYEAVGNGGFGPYMGLLGLGGGFRTCEGMSADMLHEAFTNPDPQNPLRDWPVGLLPLCQTGVEAFICLDCFDETLHHWDRSEWDGQSAPNNSLVALEQNLQSWLWDWLHDLAAADHTPQVAAIAKAAACARDRQSA